MDADTIYIRKICMLGAIAVEKVTESPREATFAVVVRYRALDYTVFVWVRDGKKVASAAYGRNCRFARFRINGAEQVGPLWIDADRAPLSIQAQTIMQNAARHAVFFA